MPAQGCLVVRDAAYSSSEDALRALRKKVSWLSSELAAACALCQSDFILVATPPAGDSIVNTSNGYAFAKEHLLFPAVIGQLERFRKKGRLPRDPQPINGVHSELDLVIYLLNCSGSETVQGLLHVIVAHMKKKDAFIYVCNGSETRYVPANFP